MEDENMSPEEAAKELGYHVDHVYRLLRAGVMQGEKKYRVWLIPRREVERIKGRQDEQGRYWHR